MRNGNGTVAKILTIVITSLLALIMWTVQETRADVKIMKEDVTSLKVAVGKLETWTKR